MTRSLRLAVSTVVLLLASLAFSGPAHAGSPNSAPAGAAGASGELHCATGLSANSLTREVVVVSKTCTRDPRVNPADSIPASCGCKTLLWTVYQHNDYQGAHNDLYRNAGTCDSAGYLFRDLRAVNSNVGGITSYRLYGGCTAAQVCAQTGFGECTGLLFGSQTYIAGYRNDHVYSAIVLHG